jgi:hypothetical protein
LEASGQMSRMNERLANEPELAGAYARAHERYLADRHRIERVPEIAGISAGGMPRRVKCLHALVAHSLASGVGANPIGDEALDQLDPWWLSGPCVGAQP